MAPQRPRRQAWGAHNRKEVNLKDLYGFAAKKDSDIDVLDVIDRVQHYIFQRRVRIKDGFRDFDRLQCGRCTRQQFIRAVNQTVPKLVLDEIDVLAEYFTEPGSHVHYPQVVSYAKFVAKVDEVFTIAGLESKPHVKVPRPGSSLQRRSFRPSPQPLRDEARIEELLSKMKLLINTRGVRFRDCFQDCERSDATSLVCPRYSGKVTAAQFRQHFPFIGDFSESDINLLVKRYKTDLGDIHFQALDRDIEDSGMPVATPTPPPTSCPATPSRKPMTSRESTDRRHRLMETLRREQAHQETLKSIDVMEKLRAAVSEKRLCLASYFGDFDQLRKGLVTTGQLHTVFTVLNIELETRDYEELYRMFMNETGSIRYRDLVVAVTEGVNALTDEELAPPPPPTPGSRIRFKASLTEEQQDQLHEIQISIRKRVAARNLPMKSVFQDFDRVKTGRVTRTQFARIMDMLRIELSEGEVDLLCQAYCDRETGNEVNYLEFYSACGQFLPGLQDMQDSARESVVITPWPPRPSKYFDYEGRVTPFSGGRTETLSPWTSGLMSARPKTR
mmetsp:Transcript_142103/g.247651  ORF Transcript_142103/g.247651 Transcript_142103/m.247651 type:complete len:559 (-) Transcript_142103:185-1861(-)